MARILVVDDSPDVRLALVSTLEDEGHLVFEAEDGDQVLDMTLSEAPELILLDVMMPRVNGIEALASLKADTRTAHVPVIMVSAKARPEDIADARSLGAIDYIIKPWQDGAIELHVDSGLALEAERNRRQNRGSCDVDEGEKPPLSTAGLIRANDVA